MTADQSPTVIRVQANYACVATDHRIIFCCDDFGIEGLDGDEEIETLRYLDNCPSQGVQPIIEDLKLSLRETLKLGCWYRLDLKVNSDRDGNASDTFFFDEKLQHRLRVAAGDFED